MNEEDMELYDEKYREALDALIDSGLYEFDDLDALYAEKDQMEEDDKMDSYLNSMFKDDPNFNEMRKFFKEQLKSHKLTGDPATDKEIINKIKKAWDARKSVGKVTEESNKSTANASNSSFSGKARMNMKLNGQQDPSLEDDKEDEVNPEDYKSKARKQFKPGKLIDSVY